MINSIYIKNIVLIESLKIDFEDGLTVFSGETGAGKSVLLNCLSLATGRRSDVSFLRKGEKEGSVTVEFDIKNNNNLLKELDYLSIDSGNENLLLRRVLYADGKSKAFINDNPVTVSLLQKIGSSLVEIHGQNEKIGLLDPNSHIKILDRYGNHLDLVSQLEEHYDNYNKLSNIYSEAIELDKNKEKYEKELKNDINLIKRLNLGKGEESKLKAKKNFLIQYEKIFNIINKIFFLLGDDANSLNSQLNSNARKLENIIVTTEEIEELKQINISLSQILIESKEIVTHINTIREKYHFDQKELEIIEQRLFDINNISRKLGTKPDGLHAALNELEDKYEKIACDSKNLEKINLKLNLAKEKFLDSCKKLTEKRILASKKLEDEINSELSPLKLNDANFKVDLIQKNENSWNRKGKESIKFLVRLNRGIKEAEIHKVSSGGELSRLMLAINLVLANSIIPKTLVFDEVDSGVSGSVADSIGLRLFKLSKLQQVLVVTHLPQVASRGNNHFRSFKFYNKTDTFTGVEKLDKEKRIKEIAKMISGEVISDDAMKVANQLLNEK